MELLFPELIANEYLASHCNGPRSSEAEPSTNDGLVNVHNLPVSVDDISHEIPTRLQRDHPIENVIGPLGDGFKMRSQIRDVNTCLYSCFISHIEPKNVQMALN